MTTTHAVLPATDLDRLRAVTAGGGLRVRGGLPHRLTPDDLWFPDGSGIIDDNVLVVVETWGNRVSAFDVTDAGVLVNRRVWAEFGAAADRTRRRRVARQLRVAATAPASTPTVRCGSPTPSAPA
jgi:sugar lactone lactonase YvrE